MECQDAKILVRDQKLSSNNKIVIFIHCKIFLFLVVMFLSLSVCLRITLQHADAKKIFMEVEQMSAFPLDLTLKKTIEVTDYLMMSI